MRAPDGSLMFDSQFLAFAGVAALLVLSPGATMVVVADAGIEAGRRAALWTVAGIGTANATLALASAFGMSAIVHRLPIVLQIMTIIGVAYMAWLGVRALMRAARPRTVPLLPSHTHTSAGLRGPGAAARPPSCWERFGRGLLTNYANPSVVLFYAVVVPQFIAPHDSFRTRYLLLGGTHVAMSVVWQGAVGVSVGTFAERMARPTVRRGMDLAMAVALLAFAVKIAASF
jgi:threonine/homoserine/homoserine lactone efflux protein